MGRKIRIGVNDGYYEPDLELSCFSLLAFWIPPADVPSGTADFP